MELQPALYITLISSVIILTVLLSFVLVYAFFVLRDVHEITNATKDTAFKINTYVMKPFLFTKELIQFARPFIDMVESRVQNGSSKKKSSRTKSED